MPFLRAVMAARKSLGLYPAGSELAASWVERLHRALDEFRQQGLHFPIRVEPHGFEWPDGDVPATDPTLEDLRFDLESRGIRELTIEPGVEPWELRAFLELLNTPPETLGRLGGADIFLSERGALRVHVVAPGDRGDPRLDAEGAMRQALLSGRDAVDLFVDAVLELAEARITQLGYDRPELTTWLDATAHGDPARLYAAVRMLHGRGEQGADREVRTRTLVEALLPLPPDLLRPFFADHVVPLAGRDALALNLFSQLTEDELRHVAMHLMPREALLGLSSELLEFPWEEAKRRRLIEALTVAVDAESGTRAEVKPALEEEDDEETLAAVRAEILAACQPDILLERSADILLALVLTSDGEEPLSAADALEEIVGEALARGRLDLAVHVLASISTATRLDSVHGREQARRLALVRLRLAGRPQIALAAGFLRQHEDSERWLGRVAEYLTLVPPDGIEEFTGLLAEERDRQVRARMCQVLARVGRPAVPSLLGWLGDSRWYVVRNVAHVLGKIGEPSAFEPIAALVAHGHPRVRLEAVRALGLLDPDRATDVLLPVLADPDPGLRLEAVRTLAGLRRDEAVMSLRALADGSPGHRGDLAERREAIGALAAIGSATARGVLEELARRRLWPWERTERHVRRIARSALAAPTRAAEDDDD